MRKLLTEWRKFLKEESYITPGQEYVGLILDDDAVKLLQSKMPEGFSFATMKTKYPRYDAVGIKIEPQSNRNSLKNQTQ